MHGSLASNLTSALQSARRLKEHPVHSDTLDYWSSLPAHARQALAKGSTEPIATLILELENELADRAV